MSSVSFMQKYETHASLETYELSNRHGLCLPSVIGYPSIFRDKDCRRSLLAGQRTWCAKSENSREYEQPTTICLDYFAACVVFGR
jgi:hypothetical protein